MPGIVVITTPGSAKRDFVNALHRRTGAVELVVVQKAPPKPVLSRLAATARKVGWLGLPSELLHARALRSPALARAMDLFKERTAPDDAVAGYLPPVLETSSANAQEVLERLKALGPKIVAIYGGALVKPKILRTAGRVLNLHGGWCPWYRGVAGNKDAVLEGRLDRLAITIHEAVAEVDAGRILALVQADPSKLDDPRSLFRDMNDRAVATYVDVVARLLRGEELPAEAQDLTLGKTSRNRDWTYARRRRLAETMLRWERGGRPRS
jgi:methionyl-tRNA formyltransferase